MSTRDAPGLGKSLAIPRDLGLSVKERQLLLVANRHPRVTRETLSEIAFCNIIENVQLRIDVNFKHHLQFARAQDEKKGIEANDYWEAMAAEISIYRYQNIIGTNQQDDQEIFTPRLPGMIRTLKDALTFLLPMSEHRHIERVLDVNLMMQQIQKGVFDIVGVAKWVGARLKSHCAPMRDEWVDSMIERISSGSQSSEEIVRCLQTIFDILDVMMMDLANNFLRECQGCLVEDTIPFLQKKFRSLIINDGFYVESAQLWYSHLQQRSPKLQEDSFWAISVLFEGMCDFLLQFHSPEELPETFLLFTDQIWKLRIWLQNHISIHICWIIFESNLQTQKIVLFKRAQTLDTFYSRLCSLVTMDEDYRCAQRDLGDISLEAACFASSICHGDGKPGSMRLNNLKLR